MKIQSAITGAIFMVVMFVSGVLAENITVGDSTGWDLSTNLTHWSVSTRIFVNDSLLFIYTPAHDVIEVDEANFIICRTSSPIGTYNDGSGETLITLTKPGARYFVCGRSNHCTLGLKVRVQVLDGPKHQQDSPSNDRNSASSSAAQRDTTLWEYGRLALASFLFAAICVTDFTDRLWFLLQQFIWLFLGIVYAAIVAGRTLLL